MWAHHTQAQVGRSTLASYKLEANWQTDINWFVSECWGLHGRSTYCWWVRLPEGLRFDTWVWSRHDEAFSGGWISLGAASSTSRWVICVDEAAPVTDPGTLKMPHQGMCETSETSHHVSSRGSSGGRTHQQY